MESGKAEIGTGPRKPGGSSPRGAAGDKAPMTRGSTQNQKVSGKKSAEFDAVGAVAKEKKNTWRKSGTESSKREAELYTMSKVRPRTKNKKKEIDAGSDTGL